MRKCFISTCTVSSMLKPRETLDKAYSSCLHPMGKSGRHKSYDTPPESPLITGEQKGRKWEEPLTEALTDTATAIVHAVKLH